MLSRLNHSLSAKLLLLFICAGAVLLLLVGSIIGKGISRYVRYNVQPLMAQSASVIELTVGVPPSQDIAGEIKRNSGIGIAFDGGGDQWSTYRGIDSSLAKEQTDGTWRRIDTGNPEYRARPFGEGWLLKADRQDYRLYFLFPQNQSLEDGDNFGLRALLVIFGVLMLIFIATKTLFKPIESIQQGLSLIGSGDMNHRISKSRNDQLGDLADDVNAMADQISDMLEAKRQLLLGISHELRSPLTRTRVHLALMDDSPSKKEIEDDIVAMEELINELLESEKLNSRHVSLNIDKFALHQLITDMVQADFARKVEIMELQQAEVEMDQARIKLLLRNLLQNAIKHSIDHDRKPTVSLIREVEKLCLYVTDSAEGIEADQIPHLTEPFYRADPSRQRKTGGYGLGLYLCKAIVTAHGGELLIASERGVGTTIRCSFPPKGTR